jgi:hypothetical protein
MNVSQTEQPILAKPHVNYLGGITSAYETNKVTGGKRSTRRYKLRKSRRKIYKHNRTRKMRGRQ